MRRVLLLRIWDMLLDFIILLARLGLKIWDCCVIYGVTFLEENLTSLPVMFRASGSCLGTTNRSRWHPQAGLWIWCQLEKLGAFRLGDGGVIWEPVPKKPTPYQPCVSRCHITGLCARADDMIRASPRAQMEVPVASVLHLWTASSAAAGKPAETAVCSPVSSTRGHGMPAEALTCFHLCEAE